MISVLIAAARHLSTATIPFDGQEAEWTPLYLGILTLVILDADWWRMEG